MSTTEFSSYTDEELISVATLQVRHFEQEELCALAKELASRLEDKIDYG